MLKRFKRHRTRTALLLGFVAAGVLSVTLASAFGGGTDPKRPIAINQTDGFGNDKLLAFTYFMNFHCTHEPFDDLDRNGTPAAADPAEFQTPICHVGEEPTLDPAGKPIKETEPLYVIVPFFDADKDGQAASPALADALNSLFGFVPDAFDPTPGVPVQCPEPGPPLTQHTGAFGTCTTHPSQLDLGPVLNALGKVPKDANGRLPRVVVPTPNHDHIIDGTNFGRIWWQVRVVLVNDESLWPDVNGTKGLTSVAAMRQAQAAGKASADVPTNFFLFFDSRQFAHTH